MTIEISEDARAKINLALHVTGQREDGYHLLDMLVTFTQHGDRLHFSEATDDQLSLSGRFAAKLDQDANNLVVRAKDLLRAKLGETGFEARPVAIHLEKNLPVASGIGGGSADAAATLRGLLRFWDATVSTEVLGQLALTLGADVPMCLASCPLLARGVGDEITPIADFPVFSLVLANPLKAVSTPEIFRALNRKENPQIELQPDGDWRSIISHARNDLEPPARAKLCEIGVISEMLKDQGALLARMSGSGATCFGVFETMAQATEAQERLCKERPDWYFQATETVSGGQYAGS
ncbi:4-(cytidine 5'-diphospho)-2-C-methyl-D-erythritol kinase [Oryzifoliimicrobium ureilyticus]|uniref:4-(cytidine 5'-diphospho)-2-C-methyl-D-erythritol kinase n=1 Tax=Oryzifoliimicrobium ureilyticus TaxID=3113724 RepID=UPI003076831E